jgi:nucleoside 2-deoxyribosyltransferase
MLGEVDYEREVAYKIINVSGPAFCPEERESLGEIAALLEDRGYLTYLPSRDGLECCLPDISAEAVLDEELRQGAQVLKRASFALEIFQLVERCDCLVFNMNGRVPDEGAIFKTSIAFTVGKPLVLYKRDHRSIFHGNDNAMISGLSPTFSAVGRIEHIPAELSMAIEATESRGGRHYDGDNIPLFMRQVVELGREVWSFIEGLSFPETWKEDRFYLLKLVSESFQASGAARRLGWA